MSTSDGGFAARSSRPSVRRDPSALTLEQILEMIAAVAKLPGDIGYGELILQARARVAPIVG